MSPPRARLPDRDSGGGDPTAVRRKPQEPPLEPLQEGFVGAIHLGTWVQTARLLTPPAWSSPRCILGFLEVPSQGATA